MINLAIDILFVAQMTICCVCAWKALGSGNRSPLMLVFGTFVMTILLGALFIAADLISVESFIHTNPDVGILIPLALTLIIGTLSFNIDPSKLD